jgi:hypothetical protein
MVKSRAVWPLSIFVVACVAAGGCETATSEQPKKAVGGSSPNSGYAGPPRDVVAIAGYVGGEKMQLLQNEKIRRILADKYHIAINPTKAGSIDMVSDMDLSGKDFVWPSNDFTVELFRVKGHKARKDQIVFNSPIVIYTGWNIADALIKQGIVEKRPEGYFIVKFQDLLNMIAGQKTWKDLGLNFYGKISVRCTDPTRSNSGNMFAGLVANTFNNGDVVDESSVEKILPQTTKVFARLGMMERSSDDIFRKFIATGTNNSMVVGYENQIVEFIVANPDKRDLIQNQVCVLYPEPTVWSSHPVISLDDKGDRVIEAMLDPEIQKLAWSEHGFRSGLEGSSADKTAVRLDCIAEKITSVTPLPGARTFMRILEALKEL